MKTRPLVARARWAAALLVVFVLGACSSTPPPVAPGTLPAAELARAWASAVDAEARDSAAAAPFLDALDRAVDSPGTPGSLVVALAALDALVFGASPALGELGPSAIAHRAPAAMKETARRLAKAFDDADGAPYLRGFIAQAEHELALFGGDEAAAARWQQQRGCAREATLIGPTDASPLVGLSGAAPVAHDRPLQKSYPGIAPFASALVPLTVRADACRLDVNAGSFLAGLRVLVVDYEVPSAQRVHLAWTSSSAAVVDAGGARVIERGFEAGGRPVTRLGVVQAVPGRLRVVARVAQKGDGNIVELQAWGEDGHPLAARAPRPGDPGGPRASSATPVELPVAFDHRTEAAQIEVTAAALMALGDGRAAEHLLERLMEREGLKTSKPVGARTRLLLARAIELAGDSAENKAIERVRAALEKVLEQWPHSWEARISLSRLTERRRGEGEGVVEALRDLGAGSQGASKAGASRDRTVTAARAMVADRAQMIDVAEAAYRELEKTAPGSAMIAYVDARVHSRTGADASLVACRPGQSRAETFCLETLAARPELPPILAEIARLRRLRDAPEALRDVEIIQRVARGDLAGALPIYDALPPGQRSLMQVPALAAGRGKSAEANARMVRDRLAARDAPWGIGPVTRALGLEPDAAVTLEAQGAKLVADDRARAFLPGAGTAVLRHLERYTLDAQGLLHFVSYDLRRVSGTTDVERGAPSFGAMIEGRTALRLLRRRIHKKDGRVLEPDAAANAAQGNSDLSQLEQGDYVEQVLEGWALPADTGQLVMDTPDLLPERTSVREAEIQLVRAVGLPLTLWAHPLLGKAEEKTSGGWTVSTWRVKERAPRRIEDGVARMERNVAISVGTQTWAQVARAFQDNVRSLQDKDPFVRKWAEEAAGADRKPSRALVERVVAAAGKSIKVASGAELSDVAAVYGGGAQRSTARSMLELGQGSRIWVIYRALTELRVPVELAVAEPEPFSSAPGFPPHVGRFRHPLLIAHPPGEPAMWIDADVDGPPLPPGHISPELRGRVAMLLSGKMVTVEAAVAETGDEIDIRLALDDKGDAKGTFTALLQGRPAQALTEAFETVVGSDRQQLLRGVVLAWVPWADVESVEVNPTPGTFGLTVRAAIRVSGYGRPEGKEGKEWSLPGLEPVHLILPRPQVATLGSTYASRAARQSALTIELSLQYHLRRRIELPAGATVVRLPAAVAVNEPRIRATRKVVHDGGRVIEDDYVLNIPTGTVDAEAYQGLVDKIHTVDDGFMAVTRVKVKP